MGGFVRTIGAAGMVLWPVCFGIADEMQLVATGHDDQVGLVSDWGQPQAVTQTAAVAVHLGLFETSSWLFLAAALLTVPAALAVWQLTVARAPAWAWTGAVLAMLGVIGQIVHLVLNFGLQQAYASGFDPASGYQLDQILQSQLFTTLMFAPFMLMLLAPIVQVIGLRRARVSPTWAVGAVILAGAMAIVLGSATWTSALIAALWVAGFTSAAAAMLRYRSSGPSTVPGFSRGIEPLLS